MNRLKKAFSIQGEPKTKKRFSLFKNNSAMNADLPRLNISTSSVDMANSTTIEPPNVRPHSAHIDTYSTQSYTSGSSVTTSSTQPHSLHSADIQPRTSLDPETDYLQLGMKFHEKGEYEKATHYWRLSAETGSPLGLFFYGIALRHGWVRFYCFIC